MERPVFDLFTGYVSDSDSECEETEKTNEKLISPQDLLLDQENKATKMKTESSIRIISAWLKEKRQEPRPMTAIPPRELDEHLQFFFANVKKRNNDDYEPSSLRDILGSIDRYLRGKRYSESVMGDAFKGTRDVLAARQKKLKSQGKGSKPQASNILTPFEVDIMYEKGVLGEQNPQALLNTVWLNNVIYFGMRPGKEQRSLQWGDIHHEVNSEGREYLTVTERTTKTRQGDNIKDVRKVQPRAYATGDSRCPVKAFKLYAEKTSRS